MSAYALDFLKFFETFLKKYYVFYRTKNKLRRRKFHLKKATNIWKLIIQKYSVLLIEFKYSLRKYILKNIQH